MKLFCFSGQKFGPGTFFLQIATQGHCEIIFPRPFSLFIYDAGKNLARPRTVATPQAPAAQFWRGTTGPNNF
jgi:hypothetical protein